jgi:hypothetical protein
LTSAFRGKLLFLALAIMTLVGVIAWLGAPSLRPALPFALGVALLVSIATTLLAGRLLAAASK